MIDVKTYKWRGDDRRFRRRQLFCRLQRKGECRPDVCFSIRARQGRGEKNEAAF